MPLQDLPQDPSAWTKGVQANPEDLVQTGLADVPGHVAIAPWVQKELLQPPRANPPPALNGSGNGKRSLLSKASRSLLRPSSSTSLPRQPRNSESQSIAETSSSRDSVDNGHRAPRSSGSGFFHTIKKKASRKFSTKGLSPNHSFSESLYGSATDMVPPIPSLSAVSMSGINLSRVTFGPVPPPSPPAANTTFSKVKKRGKQRPPAADEFGSFAASSSNAPELILDTNMDEMDGIVDMQALHQTQSGGRGSLGHSTTSGSPTHSDWDVAGRLSSSFGTSEPGDGETSTTVTAGLSSSPSSSALTPLFTNPFNSTNIRNHRQRNGSLTPAKLSPKSLAPPGGHRSAILHAQQQSSSSSSGLSLPNGLDKQLPMLPPTRPSDGGSTLPSWSAPESWAVHEDQPAEYDDSSSDDSIYFAGSIAHREDESGLVTRPNRNTGRRRNEMDKEFGHKKNSRIPQWKGDDQLFDDDPIVKAPRTFSGPGTVAYSIRVYREDGKVHRVKLPLTTTVQDLVANIQKRLGSERETHRLYLQERGRERLLTSFEKPALLVKRRLEQAGYEPADRLEELGADDISFLLKFIFKSVRLGGTEEDIASFESFVHVDLTGRSLQAIPTIVHAHAAGIVSLNLSKNPLLEIPLDFIQSCEHLREIRLSHMAVKKVPTSLRHCETLQRLDISCNRIIDLEDAGLHHLGLQLLKAQNNRMDKLPFSFARMHSLRYLIISNNKFDHLPAVVCEMVNLVDLDISFNLLSDLPEEISRLVYLERLIIVGNQITRFPIECSELQKLKELDCRRNHISDLNIMSKLPSLAIIRADHNSIHSLTFDFGPKLETLDVSYNDITKLIVQQEEDATYPEYSLKSLDMSHAKLSSLDNLPFDRLPALQTLKLDYNSFRTLPDSLSSLTELRQLSCSNNQLGNLPPNLGRLLKLQEMNVQHNNLKEIPQSVWSCASLVCFNATSNLLKLWHPPLEESKNDKPLHEPSVADVNRKGSAGTWSILTAPAPLALSLRELYLGDNRLDDQVFSALARLSGLITLNLSFNNIQDIPRRYLSTATQLQVLYLSGNKLTSIPTEDLHRFTRLRALYLNGNKLVTLPAELSKCTALEILDAGSNLLKYNISNWEFDWNWNFNLKLKYLNFSGNKRFEIKPSRGAKVPSVKGVQEFSEFNELRDLRVLGLMEVLTRFVHNLPEDTQDRRVRTSADEVGGIGFGLADTLGRMDQLVMQDLVVTEFRQKKSDMLFGMFGRSVSTGNSSAASKFLREEFSNVFARELDALKPFEGVKDGLRRAFLNLNKQLYDHIATGAGVRKFSQVSATLGGNGMQQVGASGIVVYIANKDLFVANTGDILAVMSRGGIATLISKEHDPFDRGETARIRSAEGWVSPKGMVNDEFELSRSFGMFNLLPAVNARPDIFSQQLVDGDEFIIIANRGIWDHLSHQTAVDIVREDKQNPMLAAQKLRDFALSYGAEGSTMVMVVNVGDLFEKPKSEGFDLIN